jgi:hypothetical protein
VRRSVEGELFLFHDGSVQSGNSYAARELLHRPIQTLTRAERDRVFLDSARTVLIPTLDEALTVVAGTSSSLQLDCKGESDQLVLQALELVSRRGLLSQVVVQIRAPARIARIKARYPKARILARCRSIEQVHEALSQGAELVELERWISAEAVGLAHAHGALVLINLASSRLDNPDTWGYFRSRGVDVIMTDFADSLAQRHSIAATLAIREAR